MIMVIQVHVLLMCVATNLISIMVIFNQYVMSKWLSIDNVFNVIIIINVINVSINGENWLAMAARAARWRRRQKRNGASQQPASP